jgi:ectoine hydroxylase-related dioxygenase (phytanoyl-CoA dioxygenase family)
MFCRWFNPARSTSLGADGYVVFPSVVSARAVKPLRRRLIETAYAERARPGTWVSRRKLHVEDLLDSGAEIDAIALSPLLLWAARGALGDDVYVHGIRFRAPLPGFGEQALHTDDDPEGPVRLITALVPLVAVGATNGGPRVVPRSHLHPPTHVPSDELAHVSGQVIPQCPAGGAIVFVGTLWHSGTRNLSSHPRPMLALTYAKRGAGLPDLRRPAPATVARLGSVARIYSPSPS